MTLIHQTYPKKIRESRYSTIIPIVTRVFVATQPRTSPKKKFVNPDASLSFRSGHECSWRHFYALHPKTIREITPENTFSINTPNFAQPIHK